MSKVDDNLDPMCLYAIEQVAEGRTLTSIGEELGVSMGMLYMRCVRHPELNRLYLRAKVTATEALESEMIEVARNARDAKLARVHVAALQWIIERRNPHHYGNQLKLAHTSPDGSMSPKGRTLDDFYADVPTKPVS